MKITVSPMGSPVVWVVAVCAVLFAGPDGFATDKSTGRACLNRAVAKIESIRSLPEKTHLHTPDGQDVRLDRLFETCRMLFPWCCLPRRFYYWHREERTVTTVTPDGVIPHTIRVYHSPLPVACHPDGDPLKPHGDVAEFYDRLGRFMGLAVYMGDGTYCPIPFGHD